AAEEAGAMAGGEGGGFIEEEQFGPAARCHHLAPPSPEFADAGNPGRARPALLQKRPGGGIMDDAAIAGEQAAVRGGDDVAGWRDAVLQGHSRFPPSFRGTRKREPGISRFRVRCLASPRNDRKRHAAPSRIGGWNDSAVSQGKKIQVSCDTSVMNVSTSGRPIGLAYTVAKCAS